VCDRNVLPFSNKFLEVQSKTCYMNGNLKWSSTLFSSKKMYSCFFLYVGGFFLQCLLLYTVGVIESFREKQFSVQSAVRFRYLLLLALIPEIVQTLRNHMGLPICALYGALIL